MRKLILAFMVLIYAQLAEAATYWVRPTGTMSGCTASATAPATDAGYKSTVTAGITCLAASDTLMVRGGTYAEGGTQITFTGPSGTSWSAPTRIVGYTGETAIITSGIATQNVSYVEFDQLTLDTHGINFYIGSNHVRITDSTNTGRCEIRNFNGNVPKALNGVDIDINSSDTQITYCKIHNGGKTIDVDKQFGYGTYANGASILFDHNDIYDIGGFCMHFYPGPGDNTVISNNKIHECGQGTGSANAFSGIVMGGGGGHLNPQIFNNLIYNNSNPGEGMYLYGSVTSPKVYSNTIYGNKDYGILIADSGVTNAAITNNIMYNNTTGPIVDSGSGTTQTTNYTSNPTFVDPNNTTARDFRLCIASGNPTSNCTAASAAINTGTTLGSPWNVDIVGTARPQPSGGSYDPGAYEATSGGGGCPAAALVASYGFEGNGTDSSGSGNTATVTSGLTYTTGKFGQGVLMDGAHAITVSNSTSLTMCNGFTLSGSIKLPSGLTDFRGFIVKDYVYYTYAGSTGYCATGAPLGGYDNAGGSALACYGTPLATGSFVDFDLTYDNTLTSANIKMYINGTLVTSANGTALVDSSTGLLYIGGSPFGEFLPSGTVVDEIRIYNYARTQAQLATDHGTAIVPVTGGPPVIIKIGAAAAGMKQAASASAVKWGGAQ